MKIAIFKFNHLGDNVVFVPVVQAIRRMHPDWEVVLLTTPAEADLYRGPLGPQELLTCPKRAFDKSYRRPWVLLRWIWMIRARRPDACLVSFDQGSVAHLGAKLSGAPVRIGGNLGDIRVRGSLSEEVEMPPDRCPATWHWRMAEALERSLGGREPWPPAPPPPELGHLAGKAATPRGGRARVVVHPGASRHLNQWPVESFARVASALSRDFDVVWIEHGGTTGTPPDGVAVGPVRSLAEFSSRLSGADLFLGNNSGPMHLANALGIPGVAVTGPSAAGWDPYWHKERWTVLRHPGLYCAPCERPDKALSGCANTANPMACLRYWSVEHVESVCRSRLAAGCPLPP